MLIHRKRANMHTVAGFTFNPGPQFVPDDLYQKQLKGNADFQAQLDAGFMEVLSIAPEFTRDKHALVEILVALPEPKAVSIIKTISNLEDLEEIARLEKRPDVVKIVQAKIAEKKGATLV